MEYFLSYTLWGPKCILLLGINWGKHTARRALMSDYIPPSCALFLLPPSFSCELRNSVYLLWQTVGLLLKQRNYDQRNKAKLQGGEPCRQGLSLASSGPLAFSPEPTGAWLAFPTLWQVYREERAAPSGLTAPGPGAQVRSGPAGRMPLSQARPGPSFMELLCDAGWCCSSQWKAHSWGRTAHTVCDSGAGESQNSDLLAPYTQQQ